MRLGVFRMSPGSSRCGTATPASLRQAHCRNPGWLHGGRQAEQDERDPDAGGNRSADAVCVRTAGLRQNQPVPKTEALGAALLRLTALRYSVSENAVDYRVRPG
jgi:hypothetical protein